MTDDPKAHLSKDDLTCQHTAEREWFGRLLRCQECGEILRDLDQENPLPAGVCCRRSLETGMQRHDIWCGRLPV